MHTGCCRLLLLAMLLSAVPLAHSQTARRLPPPAAVPGEFIVKLRTGPQALGETERQTLRSLDLEVVRPVPLINAAVYRNRAGAQSPPVLDERVRGLSPAQRAALEYIEPNYLWHALQPSVDARLQPEPWALKKIQAQAAWARSTGDPSIVVGILDSGVDCTHPYLAPNLWRNTGEIPDNDLDDDRNGIIDDYNGIRVRAGVVTGECDDAAGHGTHVAGIVGATRNATNGAAGVNGQVALMALRFLELEPGRGQSGSTEDAIRLIDYALAHGVKILNASWGGDTYSRALYEAIAKARAAGVLFVAAAGNEGRDSDESPLYPASFALDNILSVMASASDDVPAGFSNYGARTVHLAAPGIYILSTWPGGHYLHEGGTSAAAPFVSGAAALVKSLAPGWTAAQIRMHLLATVDRVPQLGPSVTRGRLNLAAAVGAALDIVEPGTRSVWRVGSSRVVRWWAKSTETACPEVMLELSIDGGRSVSAVLARSMQVSAGSHVITVPPMPTKMGQVRLRCVDTGLFTASETFPILPGTPRS